MYVRSLNRIFNLILLWLFTTLMIFLRYGYEEIASDLLILDLKGIYMADATAFRGDWFTEQVPQPHWIYDRFVFILESNNWLASGKLALWLLSAAMLSCSIYFLIGNSNRLLYSCLAITLLILGPVSPLGSGTLALGWSLPHVWGACLLLLVFALLYRGEVGKASVIGLLTPFAHAQHGLHSGLVLILFGLLFYLLEKNKRAFWAISSGGIVILLSLMIAYSGSVVGLGESYDRICRDYASFHCYSSLWPAFWWLSLPFILAGMMFFIAFSFGDKRKKALKYSSLIIFSVYLMLVFVEYLNLEPFSHMSRVTNVWRWITLWIPMAVVGFVQAFRLYSQKSLLLSLLLGVSVFVFWFSAKSGGWVNSDFWETSILFVTFFLLMSVSFFLYRKWAPLFILFFLIGAFAISGEPFEAVPDYYEIMGGNIQKVVPPGELIIADPKLNFVRRFSRRAVIVDSKGLPYSEPHLGEWERRMHDLDGGVFDYSHMSYDNWMKVAQKYGAKYALLKKDEPRFEIVSSRNELLWTADEVPFVLFRLSDTTE